MTPPLFSPPLPLVGMEQVTIDRITRKFFSLLLPEITTNAQLLSEKLEAEDGVGNALSCFYRHLHIENMICDISIFFGESQLAHVWCPQCGFKMTREVSECIHNPAHGMMSIVELRTHEIVPCTYVNWSLNRGPNSASEGVIQGLGGATHELVSGLTDTVLEPINAIFKGNGLTGAMEGMVQGLRGFIISPISGGQILLSKVSEGFKHSLNSQPILPDPNHRFTRDGSIRRPDGSVYGNLFADGEVSSSVPSPPPHAGPDPVGDAAAAAEVPTNLASLNQSGLSIQSKGSRGLEHSIALEMSCVLSSSLEPQPQSQPLHESQQQQQHPYHYQSPLSLSSCASPEIDLTAPLDVPPAEVTPDVIELDHLLQRTLRSTSPVDHGEATPHSFSSIDSHSDFPEINYQAALLEENNQRESDMDLDEDGEGYGEGEGAFFCEEGEDSEHGEDMKGSQTAKITAFFTQLKLDNEQDQTLQVSLTLLLFPHLSLLLWSSGTIHLSVLLVASRK
jgi:hypothetical protein